MDKKLNKIEVFGFIIVILIFSIILYKYIIENINLIKNETKQTDLTKSVENIKKGIELNKEYNINKKNPEFVNFTFS